MFRLLRHVALILIVSLFLLALPALAQDDATPTAEPTTVPTVEPTPVPDEPPAPPVEEPAPPFSHAEIILIGVSFAALVIIGWQNRNLQNLANKAADLAPAWMEELFVDFANRAFQEAGRRAAETPSPTDDENIRLLHEEFTRIVETAMKDHVEAAVTRAMSNVRNPQAYQQNPPA